MVYHDDCRPLLHYWDLFSNQINVAKSKRLVVASTILITKSLSLWNTMKTGEYRNGNVFDLYKIMPAVHSHL